MIKPLFLFSNPTSRIVDIHTHLGVDSAPALSGANDGNSWKGITPSHVLLNNALRSIFFAGPILPWLRSLDGLNTHDDAYRLSISGGVTTANVLPGSANAIGAITLIHLYGVVNTSYRWPGLRYQASSHRGTLSLVYAPRTTLYS
jgi:hypothetical protein